MKSKNLFRLLVLLIPFIGLSQHTIKGTFSPASDYEWVLLYNSLHFFFVSA